MKKTHKKLFGLLGLGLVVSMTAVAVILPSPETSAATSTSFTDTISVRVIDGVPSIAVVSPTSGEEITSRDEPIVVDYINLKKYTVTITYTDEEGNEHTEVIADETTTPETESGGRLEFDFRPIAEQFGYGKYAVSLTGEGLDGSALEDRVEFEYIAVGGNIENPGSEGGIDNPTEITIDLDYDDEDTSLGEDDKVTQIVIEVFDDNGNRVDAIPTIVATPPQKQVTIDFEKYGVPSGYYTIVLTPYNAKGNALYKELRFRVYYDGSIVVPSTADTGGLFKVLNISSSDYLITGIGVFLVVGIGGLVLIAKRSKNSGSKRR